MSEVERKIPYEDLLPFEQDFINSNKVISYGAGMVDFADGKMEFVDPEVAHHLDSYIQYVYHNQDKVKKKLRRDRINFEMLKHMGKI